jgi:chemotaxis signal transduction protein
MSRPSLLLTVQTVLHRYVVYRDQILELRIVDNIAELEQIDSRGRPMINRALGGLLDPRDTLNAKRCHALIVQLRRRSVALLVERVADLHTIEMPNLIQPLAPLIVQRLDHPWFLGAMVHNEEPLLVLDLRQIALETFRCTQN